VYVEELAKVRVVAMDKTGTLTSGEPEVTDVVPFDEVDSHNLLALAVGIEKRSEHPLAQAIVGYAEEEGTTPTGMNDSQALTGAGASALVDGRLFYVGNPDLFRTQLGLSFDSYQADIQRLQDEGKTVVLLGDEKRLLGMVAIRDNVRTNARQAINDLHAAGIEKIVMLTGDNHRTAEAIAGELGIDEFYAELKPEDKVTMVRELAGKYGHVAMVGDGVNDAPAMAEATVGVAMGAAGTDVALETADVALMADDLEKLAYALQLAKRNQRIVHQNLILSAIVISALVIGAVAGAFTLPIAVLGHEISEFIVIGNGLRMLRG
jgi:Cd2+/Zn2+-exporting ATPase